eukprot:TRINITY_DN7942_c0_g1_i1.p2 TRINITY_DN7942_c0_g1~~TRINITY_DN7942_c0_g1_i1.p2  ORF type:complete len:178 (-),score=13.77 TRINITY_DN7942_c0_g1_i1:28-561(-)
MVESPKTGAEVYRFANMGCLLLQIPAFLFPISVKAGTLRALFLPRVTYNSFNQLRSVVVPLVPLSLEGNPIAALRRVLAALEKKDVGFFLASPETSNREGLSWGRPATETRLIWPLLHRTNATPLSPTLGLQERSDSALEQSPTSQTSPSSLVSTPSSVVSCKPCKQETKIPKKTTK